MPDAPSRSLNAIAASLGIHGWSHLDPVLLASLAMEAPLLLIGPHGTGKSQLIERVARALELEFRHYNASLLNYDDLVGIPMPSEDGKTLDFIKSPGTIWNAGFVFLDEISRSRADLQNKLFPIVNERRVVGLDLDQLRHRWAAMNPPAPEEFEAAAHSYYLGSEPLDPALTDRFPFIVPVPTWAELERGQQRELVRYHGKNGSTPPLDLPALVEATVENIEALEIEFEEWLPDYIICLVDLLENNDLPQSPRRAAMMARSVVAVHAAQLALLGPEADIEESAEIAITYSLPQTATEAPPAQIKVITIHRQAWDLARYIDETHWREVLAERDPARRVLIAEEADFSDEELSRLITQTLSVEDSDTRQIGLALGMFLRYGQKRNLDPSAFEPLAQLSYHVLEPRLIKCKFEADTPEDRIWKEITEWLGAQYPRSGQRLFHLQRNFLLYGFPVLWKRESWQEALQQFTEDLSLLGIVS